MDLERMYTKVYEKPLTVKLLKVFCHICELLFGLAFLLCIYFARSVSVRAAISLCIFCGISFALLSVARRIINAPRPAQVFSHLTFLEGGNSPAFPSRHVFSASLISAILLFHRSLLGVPFIFLSLLLAVARVALGRHFPRDVIAGWLIGAVAGTAAFYLSYNIFAG